MPASRLLAVSDLHVRHPENRAIVERPAPGVRRRLADRRRRRGRARRRRRRHPRRCCASGSPPSCGCRATTSCGPGRRRASACAARSATATSCRSAATPACSPRRTRSRSGRARAGPRSSRRCSCSTTTRSCPTAPRPPSRRPGGGLQRRRGVHRRAPACARPVPRPRRVVRRPRRLLPAPGSTPATRTCPTVLVNHWPLTRLPTRVLRYPEFALWCGTTADRRLARPLPRHRGRLRPPAHPARDVGGRGAVRRGVAGLPARMARPRRPGSALADGAARAATESRPAQRRRVCTFGAGSLDGD